MPVSAALSETRPLSQVERVVDAFIAPGKTFTDILRSTSWWLPFLLAALISVGSAYAIDHKIGFDSVAEQSIRQSPATEEQMSQLDPAMRAKQMHMVAASQRYGYYAGGVIVLIFTAVAALLNWASLNFGLGATTTYGQNFAVCLYASLPRLLAGLLNIVFVYTGVNTENFDLNNPVGTNIGYYLTESPRWLQVAMSFFDVLGLWSLALVILGTAIISHKTKAQTAIVVVGWWLVGMIVLTGITAARG